MANAPRRRGEPTGGNGLPASPRELIVLMRQEADVATRAGALRSRGGMRTDPVEKVLREAGARIAPLFGATEDRVRASMGGSAAAAGSRDPATFYRVEAPDGALDAIAADLAATEPVEAAYVKPPASPPSFFRDAPPRPEDAPPATPDLTGRQGYLDAAPAGIDARWAWTQSGGRGANVNIIDVEGAWRFTHEDLTGNQGGVVGGTQSTDVRWRNHGTAVVGVYGADVNAFGVTGIAPDAASTAFSIFRPDGSSFSAAAIRDAASRMRAGDILLIELHRAGPRHNFADRADQAGFIAVEWWPDDFAAILFATGRGVIVVEAAGNGAENLDDALYNTPATGFPASWRNPFDRANPDCGAIIVGAGAPATLNHGPDRSRLGFSNFGACADAQGWGEDVCTAGYGNLQGGSNEDLWYTSTFNGTSSASPVVVGALACVQGILRARGATLLTPATARQLLRATGSAQTDGPGRPAAQRIGNRPDIRAIITQLLGKGILKEVKDKEKLEAKELKDKEKDKEKVEFKEVKDKDFKETKDKEKREAKEVKEALKDAADKRDKVKDIKEFREDKLREGFDRFRPTAAADLEARVAALEAQLAHFIEPSLRPEVGASAYADPGGEAARIAALQAEAQAQLDAAKASKDFKDSEG